MDVDVNIVIDNLVQQVANLSKENAILKAQVIVLQEQKVIEEEE